MHVDGGLKSDHCGSILARLFYISKEELAEKDRVNQIFSAAKHTIIGMTQLTQNSLSPVLAQQNEQADPLSSEG